jgi:hypothetical protein
MLPTSPRKEAPVDRAEIERLIAQVADETTDVQHRLVSLQARLAALMTTGDGLRALLQVTPEEIPGPPASGTVANLDTGGSRVEPQVKVNIAADEVDTPEAESPAMADTITDPSASQAGDLDDEKPDGVRNTVLKILRGDPNKFWTVREVFEEEVRRGWAENVTGPKRDATVRMALTRLKSSDPRIERVNEPVVAYRWRTDSSASRNGSAMGNEKESG